MKVIGIVGEYNPFHNGHAYHIAQSRKQACDDTAVVCVMSGDFVQRGSPAAYSKFARAEAAARSGVDLVLELPVPWALSSAEGFARGAVGILGALGVVDILSFGSESGDVRGLKRAAETLLSDAMSENIRKVLSDNEGISFAAARQKALNELDPVSAALLSEPNNILGIEYIKAILTQKLDIMPMTVKRIGAAHDGDGEALPRSASSVRESLEHGEDISRDIPKTALEVFESERKLGRGPVFVHEIETAALSRLRFLPSSALKELSDCNEGLSDRIAAAIGTETSLNAIADAAKSKRYAHSRIRRIIMCAALGIDKNAARGIPPYARVLAANETGCSVIKAAKDKSGIPILTKPAAVRTLGTECAAMFELCSAAHDFYVLGYETESERVCGEDWRHSPIILR